MVADVHLFLPVGLCLGQGLLHLLHRRKGGQDPVHLQPVLCNAQQQDIHYTLSRLQRDSRESDTAHGLPSVDLGPGGDALRPLVNRPRV